MTNGRCRIWQNFPANVRADADERNILLSWVNSPRAGGLYGITEPAADLLKVSEELSKTAKETKARLTTRLIDHRQETGRPLVIYPGMA